MKGSCYLIRLSNDPEDQEVVNIGVGLLTSHRKFTSKLINSLEMDGKKNFDLVLRVAEDITRRLSALSRMHGVMETKKRLNELEADLQNSIRINFIDNCVVRDPNAYLEERFSVLVESKEH